MHIIPGLTVFTGPMRSGKTTALIEQMLRYQDKGVDTVCFKHLIDDRFNSKDDMIVTHGQILSLPALAISSVEDIILRDLIPEGVKVVAIDEGHFFDSKIINVCRYLRANGFAVYVSGLNRDYTGEPFKFSDEKEHFGALMAYADFLKMFTAAPVAGAEIVADGAWPISMTRRKEGIKGGRVIVGADEIYDTCTPSQHPYEQKLKFWLQ